MTSNRKLAVIVGSGIPTSLFKNFKKKRVKTKYGMAELLVKNGIIILPRHGIGKMKSPHAINYKANISALKKVGINDIVAFFSVGSLKKSINPGSLVVVNDYISLFGLDTYHDLEAVFTVPELSQTLRKKVIRLAKRLKIKTMNRGVYVQTKGPRFETRAEIKMLRKYADVVGMNMGTEATLAKESNINYVAVCSVDNYAHGLVKKKLAFNQIKKMAKKNHSRIVKLINELLWQ
jgi:5'-methylthioadenosine phosphorylase